MSREAQAPVPAAGALIVVAHPDDETLWFEPLLSDDATVIVAFPNHPRAEAVTAARARIRERFPFGTMEFLPLQSLDVLGRSDWRRRSPTMFGVALRPDCPEQIQREYEANHAKLRELLAPYLAGRSVVYTHNPWGEYGHEEHVQVCRAVLDAAALAGASVWAWDGLASSDLLRSNMRLRRDYYDPKVAGLARTTRASDPARYRELKALYEESGAWTWHQGYSLPAAMDYVEIMAQGRELLLPTPPGRVARATGILAGHVRSAPRVVGRLLAHRAARDRPMA